MSKTKAAAQATEVEIVDESTGEVVTQEQETTESVQSKMLQVKPSLPADNILKLPPELASTMEKNLDIVAAVTSMANTRSFPKSFQTPYQVYMGMMLCKELGVEPVSGIQHLSWFDGKILMDWKMVVMLVKKAGWDVRTIEDAVPRSFEFQYFDSTGEEKTARYTTLVTTVEISRLNTKYLRACKEYNIQVDPALMYERHVQSFTKRDAETAKLIDTDKPKSAWNTYLKDMLYKSALIRAIRRHAPEGIFGLYATDEFFASAGVADDNTNEEIRIVE